MLFDTLAQSPSVFTIGGEAHGIIENIPGLRAADHAFESSRLTAEDATDDVSRQLVAHLYTALRDRDGAPATGSVRMLEKTPRNALRIPFLDAVFPDAFFLYLHRDPLSTVNSMLNAWRTGRAAGYPGLPGWTGRAWSMLLVPGWRDLNGLPLAEIVAHQWATATRILLDDLESLPPHRRGVTRYDRLVDDPQGEIERICALAGLEWDCLTGPLPVSATALTPPDPAKMERNREELAAAEPLIRQAAARAEAFCRTALPRITPPPPPPPAGTPPGSPAPRRR
jgi:hypothetical protein